MVRREVSSSAVTVGAAAILFAGCGPTMPGSTPPATPPGLPGLARLACSVARVETDGRVLDIRLAIEGGPSPATYSTQVDWGDSQTETVPLRPGQPDTFTHRYERSGTYLVQSASRNVDTNDRVSCALDAVIGFCDFPTTIDDDFTFGSDWERNVVTTGGGIRETAVQVNSGGNTGGYRRMTHEFTQTTSPAFVDIFVHHLYRGVQGTPGPIDAIRYREDRIKFAPAAATAAVGTGFVILQNGVYHVAPLTGGQFSNTSWERIEVILKESDFTPRPDFSANAARLQFGYLRSNSNRFPLLIEHGIDNWRVQVCR